MITSHSPQFIEDMKKRLVDEESALTSELSHLTAPHGDANTKEITAQFPEYGDNEEDNASEVEEYTNRLGTKHEVEVRLREVRQALHRIEQGTYGMTDDGQTIPEERLRANPAATTLVHKK